MAYGTTHPAEAHPHDTGVHIATWLAAIIGVFAAALGAYIALAPDDGTLTVFNSTWTTAELVDTWAPWLLIVGGAVAAIGMMVSAVRDWQHEANRWLVAAEVVLVIAGIVAVVAGIALLV